jgi:hypothetical protein
MKFRLVVFSIIAVLVGVFLYSQYQKDEKISDCLHQIVQHRIDGVHYQIEPIDTVVSRCYALGATKAQVNKALATP